MNPSLKRYLSERFVIDSPIFVVIAIVLAITWIQFPTTRARAQTAATERHLRTIAAALDTYYAAKHAYPKASKTPISPALLTANGISYINDVPRNPVAPNEPYRLTTSNKTGAESYTIEAPGSYDPLSLSNIGRADNPKVVCGSHCTATALRYVAGIGVVAADAISIAAK